MASIVKLYRQVAARQQNVRFTDLLRLLAAFGYREERIRGSHYLFRHPQGLKLTLQPKGKEAKAYQVRQFLRQVERYNLEIQQGEAEE